MSTPRSRLVAVGAVLLLLTLPGPAAAQEPSSKAAPPQLTVSTPVEAARAAFAVAIVQVTNAHFARATPDLKRALELDPSAGLIRGVYGAYATGLSTADRLRELDRATVDAARASTPELVTVLVLREIARNDLANAAVLADAAHALAPEDPLVAWLRTGMPLWAGRDLESSVRAARAWLTVHPDDPAILNLLAFALQMSGKPAEALEAVQRYVALLPNHPNPYDSYGLILQMQGKLDEAARQYQRALELDPTLAFSGQLGVIDEHDRLATVAHLKHDPATAKRYLEARLAHAPDAETRVATLRSLAFNAVFAGDVKSARQYLADALGQEEKAKITGIRPASAWLVAAFSAAEGNGKQALTDMAAAEKSAGRCPVSPLLIHGALGRASDLARDVAQLEGAPAAETPPDALPLAHLIDAAVQGKVGVAQAQLDTIKDPGLKVVGQGFIVRAARRVHDVSAEKTAQAAIDAYQELDGYGAFVHALLQKR